MTTTLEPVTAIEPRDAQERLSREPSGALLLDVRTRAEYEAKHIAGAVNVPVDELSASHVDAQHRNERDVLVICHSGTRSEQARRKLQAHGVEAVNVVGGMVAWEKAGLPVVRTARRVIPLDGQVRIVAGSLVIAGVALAYTVHAVFLLLAAFVGCGLVMSGVTGYCPMAMLIARMPWNQGRAGAASCR